MREVVFAGLLQNADLDAARRQNTAEAQRRAEFRRTFEQLGSPPGLEALRQFVHSRDDMHNLRSAELMQIFVAFREQEGYEDMVDLYERNSSIDFRNSQIAQECYAVACNNTGRYNKAIAMCNYLRAHGNANGEVYGILGGAYWRKYQAAKNYLRASESMRVRDWRLEQLKEAYIKCFPNDKELQKVEENARTSLIRSRNHCRTGFLHAFEYYPGINAVFSMMELGHFVQMKKMARLVHLACLRDGARDTMDANCAATMLEAACLMNASENQMATTMKAFLKLNLSEEKLNKVSAHLTRIRYRLAKSGQDTTLFDEVRYKLDDIRVHTAHATFNTVARRSPEPTVEALLKANSYSYRGMASGFTGSSYQRGNFHLDGQLSDHCLSRTDWQQFEKLLNTPLGKLFDKDTEDPGKWVMGLTMMELAEAGRGPKRSHDAAASDFLWWADKIIRRAFNTDEKGLENIGGAGHVKDDETAQGMIKLSGAKEHEGADSRTNISVSMALGVGDCRHHAQAEQIMFDIWQKTLMNKALAKAAAAVNEKAYEESIREFKEIESVELRTLDVVIKVPVTESGEDRAYDTHKGPYRYEEHTTNILLIHNEDGSLKDAYFADAFYKTLYEMGANKIDLDKVTVDADGKLVIPANMLVGHGDAFGTPLHGTPIYIPIELRPTVYAGKRDEVANDEHGRLLLLGIPVPANFDLVEMLSRPSEQRMAFLEHVHRWLKGLQPPPRPPRTPSARPARRRSHRAKASPAP